MLVLPGPTVSVAASGLGEGILMMEILVFGVGQGTCSFVFCMSKEKVGFLAQKDTNADHLVDVYSFLL